MDKFWRVQGQPQPRLLPDDDDISKEISPQVHIQPRIYPYSFRLHFFSFTEALRVTASYRQPRLNDVPISPSYVSPSGAKQAQRISRFKSLIYPMDFKFWQCLKCVAADSECAINESEGLDRFVVNRRKCLKGIHLEVKRWRSYEP